MVSINPSLGGVGGSKMGCVLGVLKRPSRELNGDTQNVVGIIPVEFVTCSLNRNNIQSKDRCFSESFRYWDLVFFVVILIAQPPTRPPTWPIILE